MKNTNIINIILLSLLGLSILAYAPTNQESSLVAKTGQPSEYDNLFNPQKDDRMKLASSCIRVREKFSGTVKICYYKCGGTTVSMVISSQKSCPHVIDP